MDNISILNNIRRQSREYIDNDLPEFFNEEEIAEGDSNIRISGIRQNSFNAIPEESNVSQESRLSQINPIQEKQPGILSRLFKRFFGTLEESEVNTVKKFKENLRPLEAFENPSSDFHRYFNSLKKSIREISDSEKKSRNSPITDDSLTIANGNLLEQQGKIEVVKRSLATLNQHLEELRKIEPEMYQLRNTYLGFDSPIKRYKALEKLALETQQDVKRLERRIELSENLTNLEGLILSYSNTGDWKDFNDIQIHLNVLEAQIKNIIRETPSLLKNKKIQKILHSSSHLSSTEIKQLIALTYPRLNFYSARLFNQVGNCEAERLRALNEKAGKINFLSSNIINNTKKINSLKHTVHNWKWYSSLIHLSSKKGYENRLVELQKRTAVLYNKQLAEKGFNQEEIQWIKDKAQKNPKFASLKANIVHANKHIETLNEKEKTRIEIKEHIEKTVNESIRDLENLFEKRKSLNGLVPDHQIWDLEKYLKEHVANLAKLTKSAVKAIEPRELPRNFQQLSSESKLKVYLKEIFPDLDFSKIEQLFDLLETHNNVRPNLINAPEIIKNVFNS